MWLRLIRMTLTIVEWLLTEYQKRGDEVEVNQLIKEVAISNLERIVVMSDNKYDDMALTAFKQVIKWKI